MYKVKEMPFNERPRERLKNVGVASLSLTEILAILLRSGTKNDSAIEVAKKILYSLENIVDLMDLSVEELMKFEGVGLAKATTILAALELGKRVLNPQIDLPKIVSAKDVFELLKDDFIGLKQEVLQVIFLDMKSNMIAKKQIFVGSLNQSLIHPREVFKYAVKYSANAIILVHNHPSGDSEPSRQDIEVTKKFIEVGEMLQIKVVDHIVIGMKEYTSILDYIQRRK